MEADWSTRKTNDRVWRSNGTDMLVLPNGTVGLEVWHLGLCQCGYASPVACPMPQRRPNPRSWRLTRSAKGLGKDSQCTFNGSTLSAVVPVQTLVRKQAAVPTSYSIRTQNKAPFWEVLRKRRTLKRERKQLYTSNKGDWRGIRVWSCLVNDLSAMEKCNEKRITKRHYKKHCKRHSLQARAERPRNIANIAMSVVKVNVKMTRMPNSKENHLSTPVT